KGNGEDGRKDGYGLALHECPPRAERVGPPLDFMSAARRGGGAGGEGPGVPMTRCRTGARTRPPNRPTLLRGRPVIRREGTATAAAAKVSIEKRRRDGYRGLSFSARQPSTSAVKIAPSPPRAISCGSKWGPCPGGAPVNAPTTLPSRSIFRMRPALAWAMLGEGAEGTAKP